MPTRFHPCDDRVLIEPDRQSGEKRSESGLIIIPDMGHIRASTGRIVAIGPNCEDYFELDDKVLIGKYAGADIELNGVEMIIVRQDDILGVITEEEDEAPIETGSDEPDPPA